MSSQENKENDFNNRDIEIALIKKDVSYIKDSVQDTKRKVSNIEKQFSKLTSKLFNDDDTGDKGIIEVTRNNSNDIANLKKWRVAVLFLLTAVSTFLGWLGATLNK